MLSCQKGKVDNERDQSPPALSHAHLVLYKHSLYVAREAQRLPATSSWNVEIDIRPFVREEFVSLRSRLFHVRAVLVLGKAICRESHLPAGA